MSYRDRFARDIPDDVRRYVKEHKDDGMDESKAWAVAWSRYCSKHPNSDHCDQESYFPNRPEVEKGIKEKNSARGDLKDRLIRLGSDNPDLRKHLRPVLDRISSQSYYFEGREYTRDEAFETAVESWFDVPGFLSDANPIRDHEMDSLHGFINTQIKAGRRGSPIGETRDRIDKRELVDFLHRYDLLRDD
jgi:hypothetical protein